jgi:hypothetical protein
MPSLKDKGIALLGSLSANMQNAAGAQTIFTVPTGKVARIMFVVVRDPSATLAGGTDYDFTNWRQTVDLSGLTGGATNYRVLTVTDNASFVELAAGTAFQITPSTGSSGAATATIDVFGYLTN